MEWDKEKSVMLSGEKNKTWTQKYIRGNKPEVKMNGETVWKPFLLSKNPGSKRELELRKSKASKQAYLSLLNESFQTHMHKNSLSL